MGCCKWLNICYEHDTRYKTLKIFHLIDSLTFIIRFIVICIDLSNPKLHQTNASFSIIIFILEFTASFPILLSNLTYCFLILCPVLAPPQQRIRTYFYPRTLLRISTMSCFACKCFHEHPAGIQLTRLAILVICFLMRFTAFVLGALCATKFNPVCVPYAVLSSLFLIPSLLTVVIEMFHFHVFWNFRPFANSDLPKQYARGFLKFIPYNMTYVKRAEYYGADNSDTGCQCDSASLSHTILYHSSTVLPKIPLPPLIDGKILIAYHLTSKEKAISILTTGFPLDKHKNIADEIVFNFNPPLASMSGTVDVEAIIYVRLSLDHVLQVTQEAHFSFDRHKDKTPEPKALELMPKRQLKVKFPRQIENWMVVFLTDTSNNIHASGYQGLL